VTAPATAIAGETISVAFTGPGGSGDFITVTAPDATENKYTSYAYTKDGSPAKIRMPLDAGAYEIRFVQGNKKVIARQPITVMAATATLDAPDSAPAGSLLSVAFTGPPSGSGDYVAIAEVGADDLKYKAYGYTKDGSPTKIRLPKEPGNYELRFIHGNKKVLARRPITLTLGE
jgi:Ca-activated chloride channel family protein